MIQHFMYDPSFPSTRPNSSYAGESKLNNNSTLVRNRSFNTPEQGSSNLNLYFMDKYWSEKPHQSSSQGPSRRHHSFINQTYSSPEDFYIKENLCPNSNRNYRRYLAGFEKLEENPSDEERTCNEISPQNSFYDQNSSNTSEYNIQMEDSFYKRFSDLKLRAPNVQKFPKQESETEREKNSTTNVSLSYKLPKYQQLLQGKTPLVRFQPKEEPKLAPLNQAQTQTKKPVTALPFQPKKTHKSNVENIINVNNKAKKPMRESIVDKENKKPNILQATAQQPTAHQLKNIQGTYEDILKKYLNKKGNSNSTNNIHSVRSSVNTPKAGLAIPNLARRLDSLKPNTSRTNKTLLIGNKDTERILEEKTTNRYLNHEREVTLIPMGPCDAMRVSLAGKAKTLSEVINNHHIKKKTSSPLRKSSVNKTMLRSSPLKTMTDRSLSNPKNRIISKATSIEEVVVVPPKTLKDIRFDMIIGQGAYAVVKLAYDKHSGKQVAVKIYEKSKLQDPAKMRNVKREMSLLKGMEHPNIIKFYSTIDTPKQIHLVMEYIGKVSLQSYLKSRISRRVEEFEAKKIFMQVCKGISYCHSKSIIHRDIKLDNILLDNDNNVKIIDFGFSICVAADKKLAIFCGTPCYMAPEIVSKLQYYGAPTDVWALGIVLYALLCGRFPFRGFDEKDLFGKIKKGKYETPAHLSKRACALLEKVLCVKPEFRITIDEILSDPWFATTE